MKLLTFLKSFLKSSSNLSADLSLTVATFEVFLDSRLSQLFEGITFSLLFLKVLLLRLLKADLSSLLAESRLESWLFLRMSICLRSAICSVYSLNSTF